VFCDLGDILKYFLDVLTTVERQLTGTGQKVFTGLMDGSIWL
jgi:hypothetical protein